jgi:hypothetical protein
MEKTRATSASVLCPACHRPLHRRKLSASADAFFCNCGWGGFVRERLSFKSGSSDRVSHEPIVLHLADILSVASGYMVHDAFFVHAVRERLAARCGSGEAVMMSYAYERGFAESLRKAVNDYRSAVSAGELAVESLDRFVKELCKKYPDLPKEIII